MVLVSRATFSFFLDMQGEKFKSHTPNIWYHRTTSALITIYMFFSGQRHSSVVVSGGNWINLINAF